MADLKITQLTAATTPVAGTEVLPIVQAGATKQLSIANLTPGLSTITAVKGGTGQTSYAVGDLLYANTTTTLAKLSAAGTTNYLLQSAGAGAPTWSNSINGITIGATTTANGSFSTLNATTAEVLSATPNYHFVRTGGYNFAGGIQRPAAIVEGAWYINTTNADIAPVTVAAADKWRVILIGAWGNYYDGFGVTGPGNYCEVTSDSNTITVGSLTVTITRNGTTGYLQWSSGGGFQSQFQGTIVISSSDGAPTNSFNVKGGMRALGVYSATVGGTNRDVFVDDTGLIGYVSSTRESKKNIANIDDVSWLSQLQPVSFNRRKKESIFGGENGRQVIGEKYSDDFYNELEYGLIADQAEGVNPELCFYDVVDGVKVLRGVHYSKLIVPLLKLVQMQQDAIDILKSEMTTIKNNTAS